MLAPRLYRAEVLVVPAASDRGGGLGGGDLAQFASQFSGLASMAGIQMDSAGSGKQIALGTLGSRSFQESFLVDKEFMRLAFANRWRPETRDFSASITGRVPTMDDALRVFNESVFSIVDDRKSGLTKLRIEWGNRNQAADWANELVRRLNESTRKSAIDEANRSLTFLNEELAQTNAIEVRQSISRLIESQVNKIVLANVRDQYAFRVLDPAVPPAESNFIWPRRSFSVAIGTLAGAVLALCGSMLLVLRGNTIARRPSGQK
jgi:ABC-type Fe3+-siderophore transport system permease subunit